jgi:hypothetical protein
MSFWNSYMFSWIFRDQQVSGTFFLTTNQHHPLTTCRQEYFFSHDKLASTTCCQPTNISLAKTLAHADYVFTKTQGASEEDLDDSATSSYTMIDVSASGLTSHMKERKPLRSFTVHNTILYYTILYYTILYYTIPYHTILYYTTLHYTTLHYTKTYFERSDG